MSFDPKIMDDYANKYRMRDRHIEEIGFVAPDPALCRFLAAHGPWIEIGAGTGALAEGIRAQGGGCVATDNFAWAAFESGKWKKANVIQMDAVDAARSIAAADKIGTGLLSSWPEYDADWCYRAVTLLLPGQKFGYIGEGDGGCTGDDQLHALLASDFDEIDQHHVLRLVDGIHDHCIIYRRTVPR
jgi:hypothetical protein